MNKMTPNTLFFSAILVFFSLDVSLAFNVDVWSPVIHSGDPNTEFGFSVELHREQNTDWLLVGAPRAQTSQPGVDEGGAVFRCPVTPLDNPGPCQEIIFDSTGNPMSDGTQTGSKSNQRFGYTVSSSGPDGPVVACAPLRMWYTSEGRYRFPVGGCFVARNNFNTITEMKPCETPDTSLWKRIGPVYCQAGMSAVINEDVLVMGGPGSIYWQGGLYVDKFATANPQPFVDNQALDDSYRGYSVAFGEFNGDNNPDLVVGLPRAPDHKGQVRLYSTDLDAISSFNSRNELNGEQVGSYFGHSLAAIDINADGLDDLIIGAPMYITDEDRSTEGWEAGRVYVYFQDETHNFGSSLEKLTGARKQARFGFSVAAIGDMDKDGFNDFAVGAPYDGEDGMGAVYIYHGRRKGMRISPAQIVRPSDFGTSIGTFGYSLASGLDMDNNAYIDLLVGAYNSSTAVLLRARPVIHMTVAFTISPDAIDLDNKQTQLQDGTLVAGFEIKTCFTYGGRDVPSSLELAFSMTLDSQSPVTSRAVFTSNGDFKLDNQVQLERDTEACYDGEAYVKNNIRDKQTPIGIYVNYSLPINESSVQPGQIAPILNQNSNPFAYKAIPLINQCKNFHCLPDLQLNASTTTSELVIGGDEPIYLDVVVANDGEDAFEAVFMAKFPVGLQFIRVERRQLDVSVTCNEDTENDILVCDLGNPFPENHRVAFGIKLDNIGLVGNDHEANITMEVKSASQELQNTTADNFANITVDVRAEATITFTSVSDPPIVEIPAQEEEDEEMEREIKTEADAGPQVTHYYMLRNLGPSNIGPTSIEIQWPMKYSEDEYLLYLTSATMGFTGDACELTNGDINPEGLTPEPEIARTNDTEQTAALQGAQAKESTDRNRREAEEPAEPLPLKDIDCNSSPNTCYTIRCVTKGLMAGNDQLDSVTIVLKSRLWLDTVAKLNVAELTITSSAEAEVQSMPYAIAPPDLPTEFKQVTTVVVPERLPPAPVKQIPLWVYVVATMVGVFILSVIILGLWKVGFFKRKKIQPNSKTMVSDDTWVEDILQPKK